MVKKDYYEILQVNHQTDGSEIKKAYRKLAIQYHPDKNPGDHQAEERFKEASEAYEVLSDPQKRQIYDQFGHQGLEGRGFHGFSGVEDIFENFGDIFEDFFGGGGRQKRPRKGPDLRYELEIDFQEAYTGVKKKIQITKNERCGECQGSGAAPGRSHQTCPHCRGMGQVRHSQGFFTISTTCPHCQGAGSIITELCKACNGRGAIREKKKLEVKIPAGVEDSMRLMVHGEGEAGDRGGPHGELYVLIHVKPHEFFQRDHHDLHGEVPISMVTAALGGEVKVPTMEGEITLNIPKGTQSGATHQVRGKGMPDVRTGRPGQAIYHFKVETPTKLNSKQEQLLKEFEATGALKGFFK